MAEIILASQSPRRKQLLEWAELEFDVLVEPTDESFPVELSAEAIPLHIALNKAKAVLAQAKNKIIIAADTVVVLSEEIINKPKDREDAIRMLTKLSGNTHRVITGVVIMKGSKTIAFSDITDVEFHPLDTAQIQFYVDKYQPYDKAGAYAIQEWIGVTGIKSIRGDFYNVMGLPVSRVMQALKEFSS
jgi:septum formation protein